MTPTILFKDDKPVLTVGSPGGATIISSVLQTILYHIEYGMELKAAVEEPRIYTNSMSSYRYEDGVPKDVLSKLNGMKPQIWHKSGGYWKRAKHIDRP